MVNKGGWGWLARIVLLSTALLAPACSDGGGAKNPGITGALWNSTTGGGGAFGAGGATLLWNDPNTAPTGPGATGGDLTFGQADSTLFPAGSPDAPHPVVVSNAQDQNASSEENTIEGSASAYHATLINGGAGGFGGVGGGIGAIGGFNNVPPFYSGNANLRGVARAHCKHLTIHPNPDEPNIVSSANPNYLQWLLQKAQINPQEMNEAWFPVQATTAASAWSMMNPGAQQWIQGMTNTGWAGAGYWTAGTTWYNLLMIELPDGQIP